MPACTHNHGMERMTKQSCPGGGIASGLRPRSDIKQLMFESLTNRLNQIFDQLRRRGKLSEADVDTAMRQVRLALLEADVNYGVAKDFVARVRERAIGHEVSKALNPGQMVVKIVNEELIATLGEPDRLNLSGARPRVLMLVG